MKTLCLSPGVTLYAENETRFKSEYLSVSFICTGELYDRAHAALLSPVLSSGCAKYKTEAALDNALIDVYDASLYANALPIGEAFILPFSLSAHIDRFLPGQTNVRKEARDLLFEFMMHPLAENGAFLRSKVEKQRKNLLERLKKEKVNKPRYASSCCLRMLCAGEPFAYSPQDLKRDLRKVTAQSLYDYYSEILKKAPIVVFYAGEQSAEELSKDLKTRLSPLFTPKAEQKTDVISRPKESVARRTERAEAHQSTLCVGYKTPILASSPEYPALMLLREMLCRSSTSLIFTELREKQSLCYYCSDALLSRKGVYMFTAGIDKKDAEKTEKEIDRQLSRLISRDYAPSLLEDAKRAAVNALLQMKDSPPEIEGWYIRRILAQVKRTPEEEAELLCRVGADEIANAAKSLVKDSVFLLAGGKKKGENDGTA